MCLADRVAPEMFWMSSVRRKRSPLSSYRGRDPRKLQKAREANERASRLESYINKQLETQTAAIAQYLYCEIDTATGYPADEVRDSCFGIGCGHNGFTAI